MWLIYSTVRLLFFNRIPERTDTYLVYPILAHSIMIGKWKWLFVNGCAYKNPIST